MTSTSNGVREATGMRQWYVVANVARETRHGHGGEQIESGLKHFAPGAKLWVPPPRYYNDDDRLEVIGIHRGGRRRHIQLILFRRHLENFRIKAGFSPALERARDRTNRNWAQAWCCPELAGPWVDRWNALAAGQPSADFPPGPVRSTLGSDAGPCPHSGNGAATS
ncbi:hypothetical protein C7C46_05575 [Streptomyces tateyamensis]|uniref:Uncharacterized protein n=1 Tax=Streptomyces tateyamensis TaxID=565073 RepID=A0A2V4NNZ0_9ACTN|nr:hypothetical protein [Streptomyces tateyamensis]PYC86581.1 hypothetical protein C7C46_05575 [Streptomyces tateyamensis]